MGPHSRKPTAKIALLARYAIPAAIRNVGQLIQEFGKWADTRGVGGIHDILYRAYFVENRDIADIEELVRLAEVAGLPAAEARDVVVERRAEESVDADWAKSRQYGITGVPTFVAGRRGLVGAQPYEVLEKFVSTAGAAYHHTTLRKGRS